MSAFVPDFLRSPGWGERCLAVSRGAAITGVCAVTFSTALTSVAIAVMLAAWAVSGRVTATLGASARQPLGAAILVFLALAAAAMLYSSAPWPERLESLWSWRKLGYAALLLGFFGPDEWKRRFVIAFLAVSLVGLAASFLAAAGLAPSRSNQIAGTIQGVVFQNHAVQGIVFSLAILCLAHFARGARGPLLWAIAAAAAAFAVNIAYVLPARSGYLALIVAGLACAVALFGWRRVPIWLPAAVVLGALVFATSPQLRDRVEQAVREAASAADSPTLTSLGARATFYRTAVELIRERPVFGYGTGSFGTEYTALVTRRYSDWRATPSPDPHNQYLLVATELGAVGLAAFIAVLVAGFRMARGTPYGWIAGSALAIWCTTSLFSSHFGTFQEGHLIGLYLGALLARPGAGGAPAPQAR